MKVVSINTGAPVESDDIQIRKPKAPSSFDVERKGDKVTITADHYAFLNEMNTFYGDLYLSALRIIRNNAETINTLRSY